MTEMNETEPKKSLSLSRPGRLELKKTVDAGSVRQSFPHGRTKTVQVEVKKKRTYAPGVGGGMTEVMQPLEIGKPVEEVAAANVISAEALLEERTAQGRHLTAGERAARQRALEDARRDDDLRRIIEAEAATSLPTMEVCLKLAPAVRGVSEREEERGFEAPDGMAPREQVAMHLR